MYSVHILEKNVHLLGGKTNCKIGLVELSLKLLSQLILKDICLH